MATKLISQLTETLSVVGDDWLEVEIAASGLSRKIKKSNLFGGVLTGGGTLATGGFTLTVPATGTAALLGTPQTFSALKTFGAGISLGNETLSTYDEGTWSPAITGSGGDPSVFYTTQLGRYTRIGDIVHYRVNIVINTISGGSGEARISLPITAQGNDSASALLNNVDMPGTPISIVAYTRAANANFVIYSIQDNGAISALQVSGLAAGDIIAVSGSYFV
jgi:hypothetical protein